MEFPFFKGCTLAISGGLPYDRVIGLRHLNLQAFSRSRYANLDYQGRKTQIWRGGGG